MDFKSFFQSLSETDRKAFAETAGTTVAYIRTHLVYGRKIPKKTTLNGLMAALGKFNSKITREELLNFFFHQSP
jgi:hypothetical protein